MSEPEKTEPAAATPTPATTPETPAAPAAAGTPPAPAKPERGKQDKKPPRGGGMPRRRMREAVPSLEDDLRFRSAPRLHELDAEIADELEAAMGGVSQKELIVAETSRQARDQAAAGDDQGRKKGRVLSIHGPDVFIDVPGGRSQGVMAMENFPDGPPAIGSEVECTIEGYDGANGLLILSRKWAAVRADWSTLAEGMIVEARVTDVNKGGLSVEVNGIRGFMPMGQIDLYRVENAGQFVNQKLTCIVTEANPEERNLVLSRKALLEKQRAEQQEKLWGELEVGQVRSAIVRNVKDFGAFVDLGGVDAFLHVSEMSWRRVQNATEVLQIGQTIKVAIIKLDKDNRKVSVSLKQLEPSPWDNIQDRYPVGTLITGPVTRTAEFGAFVELEPGLEGLIHVSELSSKRVWRVSDIVKEGQTVEVKVISIDPENRRLSLSLRQAIVREQPKPAEEEEAAEPEEPAKPVRPLPYELRGGLGGAPIILEHPDESADDKKE